MKRSRIRKLIMFVESYICQFHVIFYLVVVYCHLRLDFKENIHANAVAFYIIVSDFVHFWGAYYTSGKD